MRDTLAAKPLAALLPCLALAAAACAPIPLAVPPYGQSEVSLERTWGPDGKPLSCKVRVVAAREAAAVSGKSTLCGDVLDVDAAEVRAFEGQRIGAAVQSGNLAAQRARDEALRDGVIGGFREGAALAAGVLAGRPPATRRPSSADEVPLILPAPAAPATGVPAAGSAPPPFDPYLAEPGG